MLTIAVIGAGRIGRIHAGNIAAHPEARLAGIADADPDAAARLATALGTRTLTANEAMGADAVLICSPTPTHADYVERAAAAGKPVFCEKPIDLSAARVRTCLAAVRNAGVVLMVGFNRRFDPHFASLKQRLDGGEIGALELLTIISRDPAPPPPGDVDTAMVMVRTASGRLGQISNSRRATYGYDQRIEAHGATGLLRAGNVLPTTVEYAGATGFRSDPVLPFFLERYAAAYRAELDAFVKAVRGDGPAHPNGDDGLRALLLADAADEAARTGRTIRPAEI